MLHDKETACRLFCFAPPWHWACPPSLPRSSPPVTSLRADYTFVGYEDLDVEIDFKPRTFANTCHLATTFEDGRAEVWYAPGFGRIKFQRYSGDSLLMSDEISSIVNE